MRFSLAGFAAKSGCKFDKPREGDAGYDIYAAQGCTIFPGERGTVPTGLKLEVPKGYVGVVKDRSSVAMKGVTVRGGVIDASYRGEVSIILVNHSQAPYHIEAGQRVAQLLLMKIATPAVTKVSESSLSKTERGESGFGSTGK
jgi:dUTP pyrophosphatase